MDYLRLFAHGASTFLFSALTVSLNIGFATKAYAQEDDLLTAEWIAGPATQHLVTFKLKVELHSDYNNKEGDLSRQFSSVASYTQKIIDYQNNLMVQFSDFTVSSPTFEFESHERSPLLFVADKLIAFEVAARPDYIVSKEGIFIGLHKIEEYKKKLSDQVDEALVDFSMPELDSIKKSATRNLAKGGWGEGRLLRLIKADLANLTDWNKFVPSDEFSLNKNMTPAYVTSNNPDYMPAGTLSYHGPAECQWGTNHRCVELRFSSEKKGEYNARIIVDRETLALHEYKVTAKSYQDKGDTIISYTHVVSQL